MTRTFHLSPLQRRVWLLQGKHRVHFQQCSVQLEGVLHTGRLLEAIGQVVDRHDSLRTTYPGRPEMLLPWQAVADEGTFGYMFTDLSAAGAGQQQAALADRRDHPFPPGYSPGDGSLLHVWLGRFSAVSHCLLLSVPALAADTVSLQKIVLEVAARYAGSPVAGNDELIQYPQFAEWQNNMLATPEEEAARFWSRYEFVAHKDCTLALQRPVLRHADDHRPHRNQYEISGRELDALKRVSERCNVSPEHVLFAALVLLLYKHTGKSRLVAGHTGSGRAFEELAATVGLIGKVLPIMVEVNDKAPFSELAGQVQQLVSAVTGWGDYFSWGLVTEDTLDLEQIAGLDVGFEFLDAGTPFAAGELVFAFTGFAGHADRFATKLFCVDYGDRLQLNFDYDARSWEKESATLFTGQYEVLLRGVTAGSDEPVEALPVVGADEHHLLTSLDAQRTGPVPGATIVELFEARAAAAPGKAAVVFEGTTLSYQALNAQANRVAHYLKEQYRVGPGDIVAVRIPRSARLLVALLAVLKTGAAYLPLDADVPVERFRFMLKESNARVLLAEESYDHLGLDAPVCILRQVEDSIGRHPAGNPAPAATPADAAYLIYTSGSTGVPRGVLIAHGSLVNYVTWFSTTYRVDTHEGTLLLSSVAYDLCYTCLWPSLTGGCTLYVLPEEAYFNPATLLALLREHPITYLKLTPSHFGVIVNDPHFEADVKQYALRLIVLGGEPINTRDVGKYLAQCKEVQFVNHYGPTETTIGAIAQPLDHGMLADFSARPLIGTPVTNNQVYILNPKRQLAGTGIPGEIAIAGKGLGIGYLNDEALNRRKFIDNPFDPGRLLYLTGDLGRRLANGKVEFLGRKDAQVKISGYRVEPAEVERVTGTYHGVQGVAVLTRQADGVQELVAFVVGTAGIDEAGLRAYLAGYLPPYMIPARFVQLEAFPLMPNGKIDRQALASLKLADDPGGANHVPPRNELENQLTAIWAEVLGVSNIGVYDNFFAIGGTSLKLIKVFNLVNKQYACVNQVTDLFKAHTIALLGELVEARYDLANRDHNILEL